MKVSECEVLSRKIFLENGQYTVWNCYSEFESDFNNRLHFHDFYELSVIYEGSSEFLVNGISFKMSACSIQLIRPTDYHRQHTVKNESFRYYNFIFSSEMLSSDLLNLLENNSEPLCAVASLADWTELFPLVQKSYTLFESAPNDLLTKIYIRNTLEIVCVFLLQRQKNSSDTFLYTPQETLRKAIRFVQKNYRNKIYLSDVAQNVGLSETYFSAVFHKTIGIPFSEFLSDYRLQISERYLKYSDFSIKQIASLCGFSSCSYFVSRFRNRFGFSPSALRHIENL
jgi:AraC-like DNA-binding protein